MLQHRGLDVLEGPRRVQRLGEHQVVVVPEVRGVTVERERRRRQRRRRRRRHSWRRRRGARVLGRNRTRRSGDSRRRRHPRKVAAIVRDGHADDPEPPPRLTEKWALHFRGKAYKTYLDARVVRPKAVRPQLSKERAGAWWAREVGHNKHCVCGA